MKRIVLLILHTVVLAQQSCCSQEELAIGPIPEVETTYDKKALKDIEDLDLAVTEAPAHFLAPDPVTKKRLKKKIDLHANERPLRMITDFLSVQAGAPIVIAVSFDDAPLLSIKVENTSIEDILKQIIKKVDSPKLDFIIRGRCVVLGEVERIKKLKLRPRED